MRVILFSSSKIPFGADFDRILKTGRDSNRKASQHARGVGSPIMVMGIDALHEPFMENTNTVMVSCHGCK